MNTLQQYFADQHHFTDLLETVGIMTLEELAASSPSIVLPELHQAKRMLNLQTDIPEACLFQLWVAQALTAPKACAALPAGMVNANALPLAEPIEEQPEPVAVAFPTVRKEFRPFQPEIIAPSSPIRKVAEKPRRKATRSYQTTSYVTIKEADKRYRQKKGIKHLTPFHTWMGAAAVCLLFTSTISGIILSVVMLLNDMRGWTTILLCFGPWLLSLVLYLSLALPRVCSICHAPIFSFKKYSRNKAAHHLVLLGYVFATALHALLFRWFRCPACGSSQQMGNTPAAPYQGKR